MGLYNKPSGDAAAVGLGPNFEKLCFRAHAMSYKAKLICQTLWQPSFFSLGNLLSSVAISKQKTLRVFLFVCFHLFLFCSLGSVFFTISFACG